jgi:CRP-like cAMP-binding protein
VRTLAEADPVARQLTIQLLARPLLVRLFATSPLFARLDAETRRQIVRCFELKEVLRGSEIVTPGELCSGLFIAVTPRLEVLTRDGELRHLAPGSSVGQRALVSREPLDYRVRTLDDGALLQLSSSRFQRVIDACAAAHAASGPDDASRG